MNNAIRHTWVVSVGLFIVLFAALSLIQVALTDDLNADHRNSRQQIADAGAPRGPITVDGYPIAESVPTDNSPYDYQRVYHEPDLYSGITGFFSVHRPATGIEGELNDYLSGRSDSQFFDRVTALFTGEAPLGAQVELTIDHDLQRMAYDMIPDGAQGRIVVQEIGTGDIKALATKPSYDTNELAVHSYTQFEENLETVSNTPGVSPHLNRALNYPITPGSTFKIVDALAMLESGDYDLDTELENPDQIELPQSETTLPNYASGNCHQRQEAELIWIFANSCNTPFAEAAMDLGQDTMREAAEAYGWNQSLSIPLYVNPSNFPEEGIPQSSLAQSAIGEYEVTATPLQMTMATAAIANGGIQMHPQLVDTIRGTDLQILSNPEPEVLNEVMDSATAADITEMMVEVVDNGTGWRAQSDRFDVAAKTGTAQGANEGGRVNSWITGFAPADDPQYAVTVVYENIDLSTGTELTGSQMLTMLEAVIEE